MEIRAQASFTVTLFYDADVATTEATEKIAFDTARGYKTVKVETNCGGPAHGPYIVVHGSRRSTVEGVARIIVKRASNVKFTT